MLAHAGRADAPHRLVVATARLFSFVVQSPSLIV
jgi:hypothetical protein